METGWAEHAQELRAGTGDKHIWQEGVPGVCAVWGTVPGGLGTELSLSEHRKQLSPEDGAHGRGVWPDAWE